MNDKVKIAWYGKHFGEEPPLVGSGKKESGQGARYGAGGIFLSGCNLRCIFCQNWQISQRGLGKEYSAAELAEIMLELEKQGAVNIDLVTPTIWWRQIKEALKLACGRGLNLPVVWNSNAYEDVKIIKQMRGLIDVYLPDFKYGNDLAAEKYSKIKNYSAAAEAAVREMVEQVGALKLDENGLAGRGVIVRHMILPNNLDNSFRALEIIKSIDANLPVSLMRQYYTCFHSADYPEINRPVKSEEFEKVFARLCELGLDNGWVQEENCGEIMLPDFMRPNPFE